MEHESPQQSPQQSSPHESPPDERTIAVQASVVSLDTSRFLTALLVLDDGKRLYVRFSPRVLGAFIRQALEWMLS